MAKKFLGEFEQVVLLTIVRLGDDAFGGKIRSTIDELIHREITIGALYITLDRLEEKGLVTSNHGETVSSRGGRPRKYFKLTPDGKQALTRSRDVMQTLWSGISLSSQASVLHANSGFTLHDKEN